MATIKGAEIDGGFVEVDDNVYMNCTFRKCILRYHGGNFPSFEGCSFNECSFGLGGAASNTIGYLSGLYHAFGAWGRESTELLFEQIRTNPPPGLDPATSMTEELVDAPHDQRV